MKLLIIDDEPHIRQMMRLTLEAAGHQIDEAGTGEAGLAMFGDGHVYDAVLLDQKMPGLDGLHTLTQMKDRFPEACVVMVTAFASIDLAVDAMRLGATDFLRKPMTPETLRGAVAAALASHPRTPVKGEHIEAQRPKPRIETLTLNGFQIVRSQPAADPATTDHVFQVTHFPGGAEFSVTVAIDPEAVARVARLSRRTLQPGGAFWLGQAERLLSAFLWSEGKPPDGGRLTVHDVSRDDLETAAAWPAD
jgi:DNA-binding response OmpR family regulator